MTWATVKKLETLLFIFSVQRDNDSILLTLNSCISS